MPEPRSDTEIDADLALPYSATDFDAATARLVADVKPLRARVSELTAENERLGNDLAIEHAKLARLDAILPRVIAERDRMSDLATERTGLWNTARSELDVERARREAVEAGLAELRSEVTRIRDIAQRENDLGRIAVGGYVRLLDAALASKARR